MPPTARTATTPDAESRSAKRDRQRTLRVLGGALRLARGNRDVAAARLRVQARAALEGAVEALREGARDERALQLVDMAARRLRAAGAVERGEGEVER